MVSTGLRLELVGPTDTIDLTSYVPDEGDMFIARGFEGAGFPEVEAFWFDGAGDGATFRGARVLPREATLPLRVVGQNREQVAEQLSRIARLLDPRVVAPLLRVIEPDGTAWSTAVRRIGRSDWAWGVDTNGATYVRTSVTLRAGDPFWTREEPEDFIIEARAGAGLLSGSLTELNVTSGQAMGEQQVTNPGDAPAYPIWTLHGPGDHFRAVSAAGEVLAWDGTLTPNDVVTIDTKTGTVRDSTGANRYGDVAPAPRFWVIEPGSSTVAVSLENTSPGTYAGGAIVRRNLAKNPRMATTAGAASTVPIARRNLLGNTRLWGNTVINGGATGTASDASHGGLETTYYRRYEFTTANTASPVAILMNGSGTSGAPVTAGLPYMVSAYFIRTAAAFGIRFDAYYYDSAGAGIGTENLAGVSIPVNSWTRHGALFTPPASTAFVHLRAVFSGTAIAGMVIGVGGAMLEQTDTLKPFIQGGMSLDPALDAYWSGTAYASVTVCVPKGVSYPTSPALGQQDEPTVVMGGGGTSVGYKATLEDGTWGVIASTGAPVSDYYLYLDTSGSNASDAKLLQPGRSYRLSMDVRRLKERTGTREAILSVNTGSFINAAVPSTVGIHRVELRVTIPSGVANPYIRLTGGAGPITDNPVYFRNLLVEDVTDGVPENDSYFDGGSPSSSRWVHEWEAAANASASLERVAQLVGQSSIRAEWQPRKWVMF